MKRYGQPRVIVTDRRRSYWAAMNVIGNAADQGCGWWLNNRAENLHQTFRRREGEISKFWDVKTQQKFASIQTSVHNQFNLERHLTPRETFKQNRAAAMAEWRQLAAWYSHNFDIRKLVRPDWQNPFITLIMSIYYPNNLPANAPNSLCLILVMSPSVLETADMGTCWLVMYVW